VGMAVAWSSPDLVVLSLLVCAAGFAMGRLAQVYSFRVVIFAAYLILLYAGSRDFAYLSIRVGREPIYISEIVLIALGLSFIPDVINRRTWKSNALPGALAVFLVVGAIGLIRCLPKYGLDALRDSALCYYSLAFPLVVLLASDGMRLRALLWSCWLGWFAAGGVVIWKYVFGMGVPLDYDLFRYGAGAQALASISSVGWAVAAYARGTTKRLRIMLGLAGAAQLGIGVLLIQHRSLFIATVGTCLAVAYCCLPKKWMTSVAVASAVLALLLVLTLLPLQGLQLPAMVNDTLARIASIIAHQDGNSGWRMEIWARAIDYGINHPLLGSGFGPSMGDTLSFGEIERIDPHNSYVAIFYRMGFPGLLAFGFLWMQVMGCAFARCRTEEGRTLTLGMALSAHMAAAIFAGFNVVLEGPYMGIPFWVSLALVYLASRERSEQRNPTTVSAGDASCAMGDRLRGGTPEVSTAG
jgi:O-antigen ligase